MISRWKTVVASASFIVGMLFVGARAQTHDHSAHGGHEATQPLRSALIDCVAKGRECVTHCLDLIASGDTSIVACALQVGELNAVCYALHFLAVANSPHLTSIARAARALCAACEKECLVHARHPQCKACATACAECVKQIDKLA